MFSMYFTMGSINNKISNFILALGDTVTNYSARENTMWCEISIGTVTIAQSCSRIISLLLSST